MTYRTVDMACPECGTPLVQYEGRDKWRCAACGGALLGTSEIDLEEPPAPEGEVPTRACPQCQREMVAFSVAALTLDRCATCALIWFDRGELGKLRTALAEPTDDWAVQWAARVRFGL